MVNIQDTALITVNHCTFSENAQSTVALHVAETQQLALNSVVIRDAAYKALEIGYSTAQLNDVSVIKVAGDAISLSGSQATVRNSKLLAWSGDGISVNQHSELSLSDVVLAGGNRGLFVHDASAVQYERLLLLRDNVGVSLDGASEWYSGRAHINGEGLFAVGCKQTVQKQGRREKILGRISEQLAPGDLVTIRKDVLGVASWADLEIRTTQLLNGEAS